MIELQYITDDTLCKCSICGDVHKHIDRLELYSRSGFTSIVCPKCKAGRYINIDLQKALDKKDFI